MRKILLFFLCSPLWGMGQEFSAITSLSDTIQETSGLMLLGDKLITHNDSGNEAALYEIDPESGAVVKAVTIKNATNKDWEDICHDDTYIYIADIGNNKGERTDLKIYKVLIADYLTTDNDTVSAEEIRFSYQDQVDFTPSMYTTNYDAEAIISYNNYLYVFTKNWGDGQTNIYEIPKTPGTYEVTKKDSIDTQGMICGATYNEEASELILVGYTLFSSYILQISNLTETSFSSGSSLRFTLPALELASAQIEGVCMGKNKDYYLTSEGRSSRLATLFSYKQESTVSISENLASTVLVYPNPASEYITINSSEAVQVSIYTIEGQLISRSKTRRVDVSQIAKGQYTVVGQNHAGNFVFSKQLVIK